VGELQNARMDIVTTNAKHNLRLADDMLRWDERSFVYIPKVL
jgi:hypothetical protein